MNAAALISHPPPACLVVMGVSACGKSVVGGLLAKRLGGVFIDGDDHHRASACGELVSPLGEHPEHDGGHAPARLR